VRGKSSATIFHGKNKTLIVSFFVYRRQSRDCFRMNGKLFIFKYECQADNVVYQGVITIYFYVQKH